MEHKRFFNFDNIFALGFVLCQLALYVRILFISGDGTNVFCYSGIVVCFVFSLLQWEKKSVRLEIFALFFTVIADTFLVLLRPANMLFGMMAFVVVQALHMLYIHMGLNQKTVNISWIVRAGASLLGVGVCILILKDKTDVVSLLSIVYFVNLILNIVFSFWHVSSQKMLCIGLVLFILCDIFVGMRTLLSLYLEASSDSLLVKIFNPPIDMVWVFYLPSQTLLALNTAFGKEKRLTNS